MNASNGLSIRVFGPSSVLVDGKPIARMRSRKGLLLLGLLALHANAEVERRWIARTLWPDSDEKQALYNLRDNLHELRKALGDYANRIESPTAGTLTFVLSPWECDLLQFDSLMANGTSDDAWAAVELYKGSAFEGCDDEWAAVERDIRSHAWAATVERLARDCIEGGKPHDGLAVLRRLTNAEPYRESAHRLLMEAHIRSGNRAEANRVFRTLDDRLYRDLHTSPEPETRALFEESCSDAPSASAAGLRARRVSKPSERPRLPRPLTHFVGRCAELTDIQNLLTKHRLVTLVGTGGAGKTRLALRITELTVDSFPDGAWWIDLSSVAEPLDIASEVARAFHIRLRPGREPSEELARDLEEMECLIVLDNCEHVVDEAADLVRTITNGCSGIRVLATSRQRLGLTGERIYPTPPLMLPASSEQSLSDLEACDAVRLFLDRAQEASPTFALTNENVDSVISLLRDLDAIPFAIELAASRLRTMSVEEIRRRLSDRFRLLANGSKTSSPRQQTLRAMMDWSYDLLTESERSMFVQLAVFHGGWTLDACRAICLPQEGSEWDVEEILSSLADKSLVMAEPAAAGTRYKFLETVRAYGAIRLHDSMESDAVHLRHLAWCVSLTEEAFPFFARSNSPVWTARIEAEQANLRASLEYALGRDHCGDATLRLIGNLGTFWYVRGFSGEGLGLAQRALESVPENVDTKVLIGALETFAMLAFVEEKHDLSRRAYQRILDLATAEDDLDSLATGLNGLGMITDRFGDYAMSRDYSEQCCVLYARLNKQREMVTSLANIAHSEARMGLYEDARSNLVKAIDFGEYHDDYWGLAFCRHVEGWTYHRQGDLNRAEGRYRASLDVYQANNNRTGERDTLYEMGELALAHDSWDLAQERLESALDMSAEMRQDWWIAIISARLARVYAHLGRLDEAWQLIRRASERFLDELDRENASACLLAVSDLALRDGDTRSGATILGAAMALREAIPEVVHPHDLSLWDGFARRAKEYLADEAYEAAILEGRRLVSGSDWAVVSKHMIDDRRLAGTARQTAASYGKS